MKYYGFLILMLLLQTSAAQSKHESIKVISAISQNWIAGASPGRAGTTYTIKVRLLTDKPVIFKNLWIGNDSADFEVQTFFRDPNKKPAKGDSAQLVHVKITKPAPKPVVSKPPPFAYHGDALVEYEEAGKTHYFTIKKFDALNISKGE